MKLRFNLSFFLVICAIATCAQSSIFYQSADKAYSLFIPADWELQKDNKPHVLLSLKPAIEEKEELLRPSIQLETEPLGAASSSPDLIKLAELETKAEIKKGGSFLTVNSNSFKAINNKDWWALETTFKANKRNIINEYILKTIHNGVIYTMRFSGFEQYYKQFKEQALKHLHSFMFYTHDNTAYKSSTSLTPSIVAAAIRSFEGKYISKQKDLSSLTITISDLKNGNYSATALTEFMRGEKKYSFMSRLIIDTIDATKIVLSDDEVTYADKEIWWAKGSYNLNPSLNAMKGISYSSSNAFPSTELNFEKEGQTTAGTKQNKSTAAPEPKKGQTTLALDIDTTHKPYQYTYFMPDYEMKGQYALFGKVAIGATIGVMDFNAAKVFTVKTKAQKQEISDCTGKYTFTTLVNPPGVLSQQNYQDNVDRYMKDGDKGIIAILNYTNQAFTAFDGVVIRDKNIVSALQEKVLNSTAFKNFAAGEPNLPIDKSYINSIRTGTPIVTEVSLNGMVVRLIEYDTPGVAPKFIEMNSVIFLLSRGMNGGISDKVSFYKLGNNYFMHFGSGVEESSEAGIYEIRPNGLKKEYVLKPRC